MSYRTRPPLLVAVVLAIVALSACSSSDSPSDRADITPEALATLRADLAALQDQVAALMQRADIAPADLQALQDQVAALMQRADIVPAALAALRDQLVAAERGLLLPSPAELREAIGVTAEPAPVDFRTEIAQTARNASAIQFSRAHRFVSWQNEPIRVDPPACGG